MTIGESEQILQGEINWACAREASATEEYWRLLAEVTHNDPSPAEIDRLVIAGRSKLAARQALWGALSRLDDFREREMASTDLPAAAA